MTATLKKSEAHAAYAFFYVSRRAEGVLAEEMVEKWDMRNAGIE